jgi:N-formylglutamate deformylase
VQEVLIRTPTDDPPSFVVLPPEHGDAPIVVHVPHSATTLPDDVRGALLLTEAELAEELRRMTDHRTELLASDVGQHGAARMVNRWSRLAVDPERFLDPSEEEMEAVGMGAVYTRTSDGRPLRDPTPAHRADLLDRHFHPYHAALTDLVRAHLDRHGRCVLVDLHSYPRMALPYELHATGPRPAPRRPRSDRRALRHAPCARSPRSSARSSGRDHIGQCPVGRST